MGEAVFEPKGTVWSSVVVHVQVGDRVPPYALAYVDIDDGPRVLAEVDGTESLPCGSRVELVVAETALGEDLLAVIEGSGDEPN